MSWPKFKKISKAFAIAVALLATGFASANEIALKSKLPSCKGSDISKWDNCLGTQEIYGQRWGKYVGEFKNGNFDGFGVYRDYVGDVYVGEWKNGKKEGRGTEGTIDGYTIDAEWKDGLVLKKNGEPDFRLTKKYEDTVTNQKRIQQIRTDKSTHILILNPNG